MKIFKSISYILVSIMISVVLFFGILYIGNEFVNIYGDVTGKLKINDIIIYIIYIIQLVVTGILSYLVYILSRNTTQRELINEKNSKINALNYIRNEVSYNKNIIIVLEGRNISIKNISKHIFKMDAWNKYSVILLDLLNKEQYNKLLSYYSMIQLYGVDEIENDILEMVKHNNEIMEMLDKVMKVIK